MGVKKHFFQVITIIGSLAIFTPVTFADASEESAALRIAQANPLKGEKMFMQCKVCHSIEKGTAHKFGPNLWGVVGRQIGTSEGFEYSSAVSALNGSWSYEQLSQFLENPQKFAPKTLMSFAGLKSSQDQADVIAYLRTQSDTLFPLPDVTGEAPARTTVEVDDYAGLPEGLGREEVFYTCQACHSLKMVTQQGLSHEGWDETLDWMVEEQGMDELDDSTRKLILDYLATYFNVPD